MRVLVTGVTGQVGGCLTALPPPPGVAWIPAGRDTLDLAEPERIEVAVEHLAPDVVINCGAYTAVDKAESEPELADRINHLGAGALAAACGRRGLVMVQLSTDYVFDGTKPAPYQPDDPVGPLCAYGVSKEAGERAVRAGCLRHIILRTSWVYGPHGSNFVRTMLRLGEERDELRVVADQHGTPTSAVELAGALASLAGRLADGWQAPAGTWHLTAEGYTTWHGFAEAIFDIAAPITGHRPHVAAVTTAEYRTPARRPANSRLDCSATRRDLGLALRPWRAPLATVVNAILSE